MPATRGAPDCRIAGNHGVCRKVSPYMPDQQTKNVLPAGSDLVLREILQTATDYAIFTTDLAGIVTSWSAGARSVFGYDETEIIGIDSAVLWPESERASAPEMERQTAATTGSAEDNRWHLRKGGERFYVRGVLRPVRLANGSVSGYVKICRDETSRLKTETALADARSRLEVALEAGEIATWVLDVVSGRVYGDRNLRLFFDVTAAEMNGGPLERYLAAIHDEDRERVTQLIGRSLAAGETFEAEYRLRSTDRERWVVARGRIERDANGKAFRLPGVVLDITRRKTAEMRASINERRLQGIFRQATAGISQASLNGQFLDANERFCQITGRSAAELVGTSVQAITDPRDVAETNERFRQLVEQGTGFDLEKRYVRPDGSYVWVNDSVSVVTNEKGLPGTIVIVTVDITGRKRTETALEDARRRLNATLVGGQIATWVLDLRSNRIYADANMALFFHLSDVIGKGIPVSAYSDAVHPDDRPGVLEALQKSVATGEDYSAEYRIVGPQGTRWVYARAKMESDEGKPARLAGVVVDVTERKSSEVALRESEQRYRELFESIDEGFTVLEVIFDADEKPIDYRYLEINPAFARQTGLHDAEGKRVRELDPDHEAHWFETYGRVALTGEPIRYENHVKGMNRWFDVYAFRFGDPRNRRVAVLFTNSTDRHTMLDAVKESEDRLKLALSGGQMGTWTVRLPDFLLAGDERFRTLHQVEAGEELKPGVARRVHPDDAPKVYQSLVTAVSQKSSYACEYRMLTPGGTYRWLIARGEPRYDDRGEPLSVSGVAFDIDQRKQGEAAREQLLAELAQSESRFRLAADTMPQIVWAATPEGRLDYYNRRWFEYIGRPFGESETTRWDKFVMPQDLPAAVRRWDQCVTSGEPYGSEFRVRRADGQYRWFLVRAVAMRDTGGKITRWFGTCTDIEDQKELQVQREMLLESERAARTEAERASQMKDEFLATLSHELRTPLNAILGWSQIMRQSNDPADVAQGLSVIERNARAQSQIIEDLLDMSRIISGKVRLDVQRVDLAAVVQSAVDTIRPTAEAKGVRLQSIIDPLHGTLVSGDANRLQQVMWNLLTNAVKFTPRDGRIQVLLERVNSHLEISVIDTGEGIAPDFLPYVFDRFRQADATTTRRHGGLGLGLAIVKQLVELHGGSICVKSAGAGRGTTFIVSMPLTILQPDSEPEAARRHPRASASHADLSEGCRTIQGVRVLVVDDEPDARGMVKRLLEECDAVAEVAASAEEAVEHLCSKKYDVLVSDIGMPGEDGYALIRRVRELNSTSNGNIPAVALTAYARSEDRIRAIAAGFNMHLAKPVEPIELVTMVASAAGRIGEKAHLPKPNPAASQLPSDAHGDAAKA